MNLSQGLLREKAASRAGSQLQDLINFELVKSAAKDAGLPEPVREHVFAQARKFRLDFAIVDHRIGVEIDGGIYTRHPSHSSISGQLRDMEKSNLAVALGWRVFRLTPDQLKKGKLADWFRMMSEAA